MKGDCYKVSYENAQELQTIKLSGKKTNQGSSANSVYIVHGTVIPPDGPFKGKKIKHAWVELNGLVIERSNGNTEHLTLQQWREEYGAKEEIRYTFEEAEIEIKKASHYGPWI